MHCEKFIFRGVGAVLILAGTVWAQDSLNVYKVGETAYWSYAQDVAMQGQYAYIAGDTVGLRVVDVSNPSAPSEVGYCLMPGHAQQIAISGHLAIVAGYPLGLRVVDISIASMPREEGYCEIYQIPQALALLGNYAFLAISSDGLQIIDFSNPYDPFEAAFFESQGGAFDVAVLGNCAYLADGDNGLYIIDISDPTQPFEIGCYDPPQTIGYVDVTGNYAFIRGLSNVYVIDVSDPGAPYQIGSCLIGDWAEDLSICGNYLYSLGENSINSFLHIVNIANPASPWVEGFWATGFYGAQQVEVVGNLFAYVANNDHGLRILDVSTPSAPFEVGAYDKCQSAEKVCIAGNLAYIADYYVGLRIVDVSDPTDPQDLGVCGDVYLSRDVKVQGSYAYATGTYSGLSIIDITNPAAPLEVGNWDQDTRGLDVIGPYAYVVTQNPNRLNVINVTVPSQPILQGYCSFSAVYAYDVAVSSPFAYVVCSSGLKIMDVSHPTAPVIIGSCSTPDYARGIAIDGNYAYVAASESGLRIIDVSVPTAPIEIAHFDTLGSSRDVAIESDHVYAYLVNGSGGLWILDISTPMAPCVAGYYNTAGFAKGVVPLGNLAYLADLNYFGIYDCSDAISPFPVAVTLSPVSPPILIPPSGGSFDYCINLGNVTSQPQSFDFWIMMKLPDQSWHGPMLGPIALTLPGAGSLIRLRTQNVPGRAPAGNYLYEGRVGDYPDTIWNSDAFPFTKWGGGDADLESAEWENSGEEFANAQVQVSLSPSSFMLHPCSPNPFNPSTVASFQLPVSSYVSLRVYDTSGRFVATLVDGWRLAGMHQISFDGSGLPSGIYLARLTAGDFSAVQKLVLMK